MPIVRKSLDEIRASNPKVDKDRVESTTDAEIEEQIAADPDTAPALPDAPGIPVAPPLA